MLKQKTVVWSRMQLLNLQGALSSLFAPCLEAAGRNLSLSENVSISTRNKKPGFPGFCALTRCKQIQKALIFTNGELWVKWREKLFSGDNFCHLERGPISLTQKYAFLLIHSCKSHLCHSTPPSSENLAV